MTQLKVRVDRAALAAAATWVSQVASTKAIAAMTGVRITAMTDSITLQCFDFETSHSATVPAEVLTEGASLVNAKFLRQIVTAIKGKEVELVEEGARLTVGSGRSTYRIGTMRLDEFAQVPTVPPTVGVVARDDLAEAVGIVESAAGRDAAVPELLAMSLNGEDGELEFLATDRFRVHRAVAPWAEVSEFSARVPAHVLAPAIKGLSGDVAIGFDGGLLGLSDGERVVTTRLSDTKWPREAILKIIGTDHAGQVEIDTEELAAACKRVAMVAEDNAPISLSIHDEEIEVSADSETSEGIEVVGCEGQGDLSLSFNPTYLVDALLASGASRMRLSFTPPTGARTVPPIILRPLDSDACAFVVMPRKSTR